MIMDALFFAAANGIWNLPGTTPPAVCIIANGTRPVDEEDAFPGEIFHTIDKIIMDTMTLFKMKIDFIVLK
ncbi:MAG: hypothetical protein WCD00_08215 [Desulfuromonadaceae bacterium]